MASIIYEDESSDDNFSDYSQYSSSWEEFISEKSKKEKPKCVEEPPCNNLAVNILNRQIYGRFTKHARAKTERAFRNVQTRCKYALSSLIKDVESLNHVFMGFTMCGQYFLSYTVRLIENYDNPRTVAFFDTSYDYELYLWRFVPGHKLKYLSKYKIFKHLKGPDALDKVTFMQFPKDVHKIVCYGLAATNPDLVYITILTLPATKGCRHCRGSFARYDEFVQQGWCVKHGFIIHYMFSMSQPTPVFDPHMCLAYPNHLVINTGHHIHILNTTTLDPPQANVSFPILIKDDEVKINSQTPTSVFNDTLSEVSESPSEHFDSSSVVDAILEDFSEYDLESSDGNKPFHELNISCEPLNVTGKSYHNTLVQNILDPRLKRLQNTSKEYLFSIPQTSSQKPVEKSKIDKKIAEKAYEFIEENEKYEKISLFRKKRLAEKKYEFSEDNSENIVPYSTLRRERRYLCRSRCIRSPDFNSLFLSPRSPGWRSPMQSPSSRNGQFSPSSARNSYATSIRNSPHHSKSPISPRESARKFHVYSPSLESDYSDSDSRLILRTPANFSTSHSVDSRFNSNGLLIVDFKTDTPKWIKKVVRRYSNGDFENSSLVSGQSRDDYNIPIEIPMMVQSLTEQHFDVVPDFRVDHLTEMQLIVTQRSLDFEQFVQKRAQTLCSESNLEFLHCEDYDIKIIHICPLNGHIICEAVIKIGASSEAYGVLKHYTAHFLFSWNIATDAFDIIEPNETKRLVPSHEYQKTPPVAIPKIHCNRVLVMDCDYTSSKTFLRDFDNYFEICLGSPKMPIITTRDIFTSQEYYSDSD